ncbi:MAG: thiamine ABC transporter substrate-binding protein [Candidatus Nanopelagicales bacterium]
MSLTSRFGCVRVHLNKPRSRTSRRTPIALAAVLSGCLALAGCSTGSSSSPTSPAVSSTDTGPVRLVTYDAYAISNSTLAAFTRQTGIKVEVTKSGDGAEVVNRAILTKDNPEGDVLFGIDNNLLSRAFDASLFQPYAAKGLDAIPAQYRMDPQNRITPIDVGDVCVNYDRLWFGARGIPVPTTLTDLTDPKYKDLLVTENPATSTPGLAFLLATVASSGPDHYVDYWKALKNNGVKVDNSWDSAYEKDFSGGSGHGDRPLVVSYASSPAASVVYAQPKPKDGKSTTGSLDKTCYRQIEFAGVLSNSPHIAAAQKLIDFMITKTYQEDLPLNDFVFPVAPGVPLPKVFTDNATLVAAPFVIAPDQVAANRDRWVSAWTDAVQR